MNGEAVLMSKIGEAIVKWITLVMFFVPPTILAQPQSPVDLEKEKAALLRVHKGDREAHLKTDVELLQEHSP